MRYIEAGAAFAAIFVAGAGMAIAQTAAPGAPRMAKADCQAIWSKADSAQMNSVTSTQAAPYVTNFKAVDTNGDGKLSSSEFMSGCEKGLAHDSASSGAGAGTSGKTAPPKQY